jgi:hypothetical protein
MGLIESDDRSAVINNAHYLAHAAELAYFNEPEGPSQFKDLLGLDARLISVSNTQVYVGGDAHNIVAAFRGSERPTSIDGLRDWLLTNANNLLILPEGDIGTDFAAAGVGARFHRGFMTALADVWAPFLAAIEKELEAKDRLVWVCGHSLGGALALLASWRLRQKYVPVHRVFTFGAPMVGNKAAAAAFDREMANRIYRFVDSPDLVPMLPMFSLIANEYVHCNRELILAANKPTGESASDSVKSLAQSVGEIFDGKVMDLVWGQVQGRLNAHDIVNYRNQIKDSGLA